MTVRQFPFVALGTAVLLAILIQIPAFIQERDQRYRGVPIHLNSDEYVYFARVEQALIGDGAHADNAFIADRSVRGTQSALLERMVGTLFRPTGWSVGTVLTVMDSVTIAFLFLALIWFLQLCGFRRWYSYGGALAFCVIEFYNLNRPIHQGLSFLLTLFAMAALVEGMNGRRWLGILGGAMLGLLVGVYFWAFTWIWLFFGLLALISLLFSRSKHIDIAWLVIFGVTGMLTAFPFVIDAVRAASNQHFAEAVFRSGMHPGRLPESMPYSILFTVMAGSVLWLIMRERESMRKHAAAAVIIFTGFIAIHQQLVHGQVFNFVSHYMFGLVLAALCMVLLAVTIRKKVAIVVAAAAIVYLSAVAWDGRYVLSQFRRLPERFHEQHLAGAFSALSTLPRATVLSDPRTSLGIAAYTHHDVVYALYLKNLLLSHEQIAARYCLTQLPVPPEERRIREQEWLVYPDANSAFRDPAVREREVRMVEEACAAMDRDPVALITAYGPQYILWDRKDHPEWNFDKMGVLVDSISKGEEWEILRVIW
ncbi:MAG: hypothetical protein Greene041619_50 [Candidatus Peregrinibacteria bacterium Greene0416_19]|nr:MAG: hypothetical protein Greene041619_50 [Candidatus Peregrinibacteria bacterium Greene0416_19]